MSGDADRLTQCKSDIRSVLIAAKNGFTASELIRDYKEFVGGLVPFCELGYRTLHELLENMPDVCRIEAEGSGFRYHAVADESTQNLKKLVSRQKTNKKKKKGGGYNAAQASWCRATNYARNHNSRPQRTGQTQGSQPARTDVHMPSGQQRPNPTNWIILCLSRHAKGINVAALKNEVEQKAKGAFKFTNVDELRLYLQSIPAIVFYDQSNDTVVLRNQTTGISPVQPPPGFFNYPTTAPALIHPFFVNTPGKIGSIETSSYGRPFSSITQSLDLGNVELSESDKIIVIDRVVRIVKDHSSGLKVPLIEALYLDRHSRPLPLAALNHNSLVDFLSTISGIKVATINDEDYAMYIDELAPTIVSEGAARPNVTNTRQLTVTPNSNSSQRCLSGFAEIKDKFTAATLPSYNEPFTGVIVTFYSVEDFFIQRADSKMLLQQLLDSLKSFYGPMGPGDNEDTFIAPELVNDLSGELPCAVYWRNGWYRGYILGCQGPPSSNPTVSVRLVDIGILDTVSLEQTRRLAVRFLTTPVQVLRARLARILKPSNSDFLMHKCRCYVDRITSRRQITATPVKDSRTDLRAVGRLPVIINVSTVPGLSNDSNVTDLSSHLICCGLAVADRTLPPSYGIIGGYGPQLPQPSQPQTPPPIRCTSLFRGIEVHKPVHMANLSANEPITGAPSEINGLAGQLKKCMVSYEQRFDVDEIE